MTLHIKFTHKAFDKNEAQLAVVTLFSDVRPLEGVASLVDWRLNGRLSRVCLVHRFEGEFKDILLLPSEGRLWAKEILILGLGASSNFNESHIGLFIQFLLEKLQQKKITDFVISLADMIPDRFEWRNAIRLLVSKLHDFPSIEAVILAEGEEHVKDAKRRHMDFGLNVDVVFEIT